MTGRQRVSGPESEGEPQRDRRERPAPLCPLHRRREAREAGVHGDGRIGAHRGNRRLRGYATQSKDEATLVDPRRPSCKRIRVREDVRRTSGWPDSHGRVGGIFGSHLAPP